MNYLEFKHLRMICAITETGNMTKAAQKLYISQPALSQQLKDIEGKSIVQRVFEQSGKCTELSEVYVATDHEQRVHNGR